MAPEIDVNALAAALADGATVIDVREPFEYVAAHVPGAVLVPLGSLPDSLADVPRDQPVYVVCATGNRSLTAAAWLRGVGVDAFSVAGGTRAWLAQGRPVVHGRHATSSVA